jgi:NADPH:quinone reductase-like Zn-dependent oxidoreductase
MKRIVVNKFGGPDVLQLVEELDPTPGPGQVVVRLTSIGMNHAELMGRRGEYKISTGEPPFTPGLEGGGVIQAVGEGVNADRVGQRVVLGPGAPRLATAKDPSPSEAGGTYRTHYLCDAHEALPAPDALPDDQLGTLWLAYLTAWGCLIWKQGLQPGQVVGIPAASSSVGLAAAQVVKAAGGTAIGLTSSPGKVEQIQALDSCDFDHVIVTHQPDGSMKPWRRELRELTGKKGVDVFFDPVAAGPYLAEEVKSLAMYGTVWVYGLLGDAGPVDVSPLIRLRASIRGWVLTELVAAGPEHWLPGCEHILEGFADGTYRQHLGGRWSLEDVAQAHELMQRGQHIGKLVLVP